MSTQTLTATVFLPTAAPKPLDRPKVEVRRSFSTTGARVAVDYRHPLEGFIPAGWINSLEPHPGDVHPRFRITDYDGHDMGEHVGDYLDAELVLLTAVVNLSN